MAESNAFLAYGVTVTTESLPYAVAAWPKLQGPFTFLDLVQLRRSKGMLRTEQRETGLRSVVERVPSEVWDIVRHKVVDLELREAEIAHVKNSLCAICRAQPETEELTWEDCINVCWVDADDTPGVDFRGFAEERRLQVARSMLATFGLALPTRVPIRFDSGHGISLVDPEADPRTATMISLAPPSACGDDAFATYAHGGGGFHPVKQVILDVSLEVPPDATARFRRLVAQLHLQLIELTDGILANACSETIQGKTKLRHDKRKCKEVPLDKIRPGWKLSNTVKTT
ncbi:hypothetical protein JCM10449v2_001326 [Rhodotorula kratochvilovae]